MKNVIISLNAMRKMFNKFSKKNKSYFPTHIMFYEKGRTVTLKICKRNEKRIINSFKNK